jgi:hypothetical protein
MNQFAGFIIWPCERAPGKHPSRSRSGPAAAACLNIIAALHVVRGVSAAGGRRVVG